MSLQPCAKSGFKADISRIVKYAPAELIGREDETKLLNDAWQKTLRLEKGRPRVLTFVALGGEGKTSLVAKWAAEMAGQDWPGCDAAFAWSFYSQGTREQVAASSELFLKEALTFFGDNADKEFAASNAGAYEKGQHLARLVARQRSLLILDGLEPLQYLPTAPTPGELKDQGLGALLKGLATDSHSLCVVTTRYSLPDLKTFWQSTAPEKELKRLSKEAGVHLLQRLGVRKEGGATAEFETLVEDVKGHALTLTLLGTYLRDAHGGDIRKRDLVQMEDANAEEQGGHAFHVMAAYECAFQSEGNRGRRLLAVLRLLGLFDRPMTADCLAALLREPAIPELTQPLIGTTEVQRNLAFKRLEDARLLTLNRDRSALQPPVSSLPTSLDAHPLLREYFARQLRTQQPDAWRAAHRRLYEHLCTTTTDKKPNPTLEDLQPLYQAVAHGCQAGRHQEVCDSVYRIRLQRGLEYYSATRLGAYGSDLGAVACFFEAPWSHISAALIEADQAWMLFQAAFNLRALGRLIEALGPMQAGLTMALNQKDWVNAAIRASNLSELKLTLGEVAVALNDAEQSVIYADLSGDAWQRVGKRTTFADALQQAGRRIEAEARFVEAENMYAESQSRYPVLFGFAGFRYCDLLLTTAERIAWQTTKADRATRKAELMEKCRAVSRRAAQGLTWEEERGGAPLLHSALHHLTIGRAALYEAILDSPHSDLRLPRSELDLAVLGLRRAGTRDQFPRSLLARAWLRFLTGARTGPESSQADLDEAWEIAERGPMRLHMADIHLYRARLFFREKRYPWESPAADLGAAEKLINECGYHRRDEELADAKHAILGN